MTKATPVSRDTSFSVLPPRGEWPADVGLLPLFFTEEQLAHLLGKTVRTLQRHRREGRSIPFRVVAPSRNVIYAREDVLNHFGSRKAFTSTREAEAARST